jgi:hypothetical protein
METHWRVAVLAVGALLAAQCGRAQNAAFDAMLKRNRFELGVIDGKLDGRGYHVIRGSVQNAQFVLVGEDHGIAQIPEFMGALCRELAPKGFHTMALETGPAITPELEKFARSADGAKQLAAFDKKYPASVAFYNWAEEFAMLQECEKAADPEGMKLWGVDQELMGSSGFLLEKILATHPGPQTKSALQALLQENADDYAQAAKTGSPGDVFMMKAKQKTLDTARDLLKQEGSTEAQQLFAALLESRDIYSRNLKGDYYTSNRERALLMKTNFAAPLGAEMQKAGRPPKVLFKFGAWHMYRGINPLHSSELGNLAGEFAEAHGAQSLHILILGVKGEQSRFAGIGKPFQPAPLDLTNEKDSDFSFLAPLFANRYGVVWTLYDVRGLRDKFNSYGKIDPELERVIFGYDLVVLIPDPKASHQIE